MFGALYAQLAPAVALLLGRNRSRGALLVVAAFLFSLGTDLLGRYIGQRTGNSLWVSTLSGACIQAILLFAFAEWQTTARERALFRLATLPTLAAYAALIHFVDGLAGWSRFAYPFGLLVTLGGACWTLIRRTLASTDGPAMRTDWFWLLVGVALNCAVTLISSPLGAVLLAQRRYDLFQRFWDVRSVLVIVAIALVTIGAHRPAAATGPEAS